MTTPLRSELSCRHCGGSWAYRGTTTTTKCPHCGARKDARDRSGLNYSKAGADPKAGQRKDALVSWYSKRENRLARDVEQRVLRRKKVLFRVSGTVHPVCVRCGCSDARLLEVNHKYGGGNRELQDGKNSQQFYNAVATGARPTDDLELLCKPCNAIHALELRFGPLPLRVVWGGE